MDISVSIDKAKGAVSFLNREGEPATLVIDDVSVESAAAFPAHDLLLLLIKSEWPPQKLEVWGVNLAGEAKFTVSPPKDSDFYYLTTTADGQPGVVCVSDGKPDWLWEVNHRTGTVRPLNRAY